MPVSKIPGAGISGGSVTVSQTAPDNSLVITSTGNVGIGTNSPTSALVVSGGVVSPPTVNGVHIGTQIGYATIEMCGTSGTGSFIDFTQSGTDFKGRIFYDNPNNLMSFATNNAERMRVTSDAGLCVGTVGNYANGTITGFNIVGAGGQVFRSDSSLAAGTGWGHFYGTSSTNTVANIVIYGNGTIQNATGSYGAFSDLKLKENIVDASPKLDDLLKVRVVNYTLKSDEGKQKQIGIVAQELETVFPGLVDNVVDRDSDGKELDTVTKGVKYSVFIPMLIKAMQEQQAIIEELKARIETLEAK